MSPFLEQKESFIELADITAENCHEFNDLLSDYDINDLVYRLITNAWEKQGPGVVLRRSNGHYAILLRDPSVAGAYRYQECDSRGFFGHSTFTTIPELIEYVVRQGYHLVVSMHELSELTNTAEWKRGSHLTNLVQKVNSGQMTYQEAAQEAPNHV